MDFNDSPQRFVLHWKSVALVAGGVIVLLVGVVIVVRFIQGRNEDSDLVDAINRQVVAQVRDECEGVEDETGCRDARMSDAARAQGAGELCEMIDAQEAQDNCYWGLARDLDGKEFCQRISGVQEQARCRDDVHQHLALLSGDVQECEAIEDEARRAGCKKLLGESLNVYTCDEAEDPVVCADLALWKSAHEELDPRVCDQITDERRRDSCLEGVRTMISEQTAEDSDSDGLSDSEEETYGTDSENPDTDGDGYFDGDEVAAGYDPNGPGVLQ
ncbi:MAG: hypothetical protein UY76_C0024G0003 [Candidatus Uhrbacteria bacterium GW2011_GWA2_52_8d]|uniref:Uncharacterized protein n=1 Tax=Candidatus Uhrbacteria bacterium GW2011_GWA2_52_8d TaxID=1618979 RepID=A0A0G2AIW5_9BACT|nr:MAG: hypothetical protein UY76_C0024G0003 [Candidatus Uhrbacteria bacterium GW2011_GWA2_52_8d]